MLGLAFLFLAVGSVNAQDGEIGLMNRMYFNRPQSLDPVMIWTSRTTTPIALAMPATLGTVGMIKRDSAQWLKALYLAETYAVNGFITVAMKYSIQRPRPFVTNPAIIPTTHGGSPSFPSGHTSEAFSMATAITMSYPKWYVATPAFLWAGTVGYSRIHTGVHYPSDVAVGALIGAGSALLSAWVNQRLFQHKKWPNQYGH